MWGGDLSLDYAVTDASAVYALIARGYKAGGVNGEALGKASGAGLDGSVVDFLESRLEYDSETLINYELGYRARYAEGRLMVRAAVFWMDRDHVQLKSWYNEGPAFVGYTDNAASGQNSGLELETQWQATDWLLLSGTLGLLDTEIDGFAAFDVDNPDAGPIDRSGRDQAHAPNWQFSSEAEFRLPWNLFLRVEYEGRDGFFYSDSHDARSDSYRLLNLSGGVRGEHVELTVWVRNVTDEDYTVRGFYFGNDPRDYYANKAYVQFGEPRVAGVTARYRF
jgi:outer membrane receptor protein involved in Fe transport